MFKSAVFVLTILLALAAFGSSATDLSNLPPNTWVPLKYTTEQQPGGTPGDKGGWGPAAWNKLVYDPVGKRVLFNDLWVDKKHGGGSIYGNCVLSVETATMKLSPIKINNWFVEYYDNNSRYRVIKLAEDASEPTPCSRHVYHCFEYIPEQKAVYLCNGACGAATVDGQINDKKACGNTWRLDMEKKVWTEIKSPQFPPYQLDCGMAYCPDTKSIIYSGGGSIWILDVTKNQWRKAKHDAPTGGAGQTVFYDPPRKRMLLVGGNTVLACGPDVFVENRKEKDPSSFKVYAFDPVTETCTKLADCPAPQYESHMAYDSKHDVFLMAYTTRFGDKDSPSGTFCYDPKKDVWTEVKTANPTPPSGIWYGWIRMCYDSEHDCFIGLLVYDQWYAFKYVPTAAPAAAVPAATKRK